MGYYVYILSNSLDKELYKGFTEHPAQRLEQHNNGEAQFTSTKKNWKMEGLFLFETKKEALIFEKKIKKWNRRSLQKHIEADQNILLKFQNRNEGSVG